MIDNIAIYYRYVSNLFTVQKPMKLSSRQDAKVAYLRTIAYVG